MTTRSPRAQHLAFRLAFLLAITLLPLGVIAGLQSHALLRESRARSEAVLTGATRMAAAEELRAVQMAQGAAQALSFAAPRLEDDLESCIAMMADLVETSGVFSFAGYYDVDGNMECSSAGRPFRFEPSPERDAAVRDGLPSVHINQTAPLSGTSVLFAQHPVFSPDGRVIAFTAVSVPHSALSAERAEKPNDPPILLVTFNKNGELITSSVGIDDARPKLPQGMDLKALVGETEYTFSYASRDGDPRVFSVVPLVPNTLYALGSWPVEALPGPISWSSLPAWLVPVLMWVVSLVVAIVAAERLVARHIKALTNSIVGFARGDRLYDTLDLKQAPTEIREAGEAFDRMREAVLRDEAELEDTVHQKEVLLREVHHRVKNNLQLIASIMNLQARRAMSPEAKYLIKRLNERVMSLATIHKSLYQTTGVADVKADELLSDIIRQLVKMATGPDNRFSIETRLAPLRMTPDQAVPLALLVTEAFTNALKYANSVSGARPSLAVTLREESPGNVQLDVSNSYAHVQPEDTVGDDASGLGSQLVEAFVRQLGGAWERHIRNGTYTLSVRFPLRALTDAEARVAEATVTQ